MIARRCRRRGGVRRRKPATADSPRPILQGDRMPIVRGSIVVVDDDADMRHALGRLLTAAGFQAMTFPSAEALLDAGAAEKADCLILDLHLPGLSGLDLSQLLRARGLDTPVVFITAYDDQETRARAEEAGALGYFSKPFQAASLLAVLERARASA